MGRLDGTVALVTGASAGIGRAVCRELVRRGACCAMVARRKERLAELEAELGASVLGIAGDVTAEGDLEAAVERTRERFGRISMVLANAGYGVGRPVERLTVEDFRRQLDTNFFGVLRTLYASLEDLRATRGVFAVMGSVSGYISPPGSVAYATSKFAVRGLAEGLRAELAPAGVAVVLLSPGFITSEIRQVDREGRLRPEWRDPVPGWLRMPADAAARATVRAMARRRREAVITAHGRALVLLARHCPRTTALLLRLLGPRRRQD